MSTNRLGSHFLIKALILSVIGTLSSCGGGGGDSDGGDCSVGDGTFTSLYSNVFSQKGADCANSDCHTSLDFTSQSAAWASMSQTGTRSGCQSQKIVVAGSPNSSLLYASIDQSAFDALKGSTGCNAAYNQHDVNQVFNGSCFSSYKSAIKSWIAAGAKNN